MITQHLIFLSLISATFIGCGTMPSLNDKTSAQTSDSDSPMTDDEEAANLLYLDEVDDSAAEDIADSAEVDTTVKDDISERRLNQMANMKFDRLDKDNSETLTLDEFLSGPGSNPRFKEMPEEKQKKKIERITADFKKYAGTDELLVVEELKALLKDVAPRVGRHRHQKTDGKHEDRIKLSWEEIVKLYDKDGDQKLNKEEHDALRADRKAKHEKWGKRKHKGHGPGENHKMPAQQDDKRN